MLVQNYEKEGFFFTCTVDKCWKYQSLMVDGVGLCTTHAVININKKIEELEDKISNLQEEAGNRDDF